MNGLKKRNPYRLYNWVGWSQTLADVIAELELERERERVAAQNQASVDQSPAQLGDTNNSVERNAVSTNVVTDETQATNNDNGEDLLEQPPSMEE